MLLILKSDRGEGLLVPRQDQAGTAVGTLLTLTRHGQSDKLGLLILVIPENAA